MKRLVFIICIGIVIAILTGCNHRKMRSQLDAISKMADINPDSALSVLSKYESEKDGWAKGDRMHFELVKMKAQNKNDVIFTTDSIIKTVVEYYKNSGMSNELLNAYYLLGRVHCDMGETPEALQAYYDAIEVVDTTKKNTDYKTLIAVYGQMSRIFHKQNLPEDEIWALKHYIEYIKKTDSKKEYIIAHQQLMRPYYLLNEIDSILKIVNDTYLSLKQLGEDKEAADALVTSIYIYVERGELNKAREAMDIFEKESGLFDKNGDIQKGRESYYNTKGYYELAMNDYKTAEYYFRKAIRYGCSVDAFKGMLSIFREKNNIDSVMHYSELYESSLDSLHYEMQTDAIHQISALYNYNRSLKVAEVEAQKARNAKMWLMGLLFFVTLFGIVFFYFYLNYKRKKQTEINKLIESLTSAKLEYQNVQTELKRLKVKDYEKLIADKEKKEKELEQTIAELLNATGLSLEIDNLDGFEKSKIVEVFHKKKEFRSNNPVPNKAEWRALEIQFSKDMPSTYNILAQKKKLSPMELHVCILLILGFEDSAIVNLTDSISQTVTTAKSRANRKIFEEKGAQTLKAGLFQLIKNT